MASPSGSEGRSSSSSSGEEHSPSVQREESTATQSTMGDPSSTEIGTAVVGSGSIEHRTVPIGGEAPRTVESSGGELYPVVLSGDAAAASETHSSVGGGSDAVVASETSASGGVDNQPISDDNAAMQSGESGSRPIKVDVQGTGAQVSEVEMDIEGVHVMVEQRPAREGADTGSRESLVPSDLLSASLVIEVPVGGERTSVVIPVVRRDLGNEKVIVEEA